MNNGFIEYRSSLADPSGFALLQFYIPISFCFSFRKQGSWDMTTHHKVFIIEQPETDLVREIPQQQP